MDWCITLVTLTSMGLFAIISFLKIEFVVPEIYITHYFL